MIAAGVPVTVRGDDLPLADAAGRGRAAGRAAVRAAPRDADRGLAERAAARPLGGADTVYLRRLRRVLARQLGDRGRPAGAGRSTDAAGAEVLPGYVTVAGRSGVRPGVLSAGPDGQASAGANAEDVLWASWAATGLADRWQRPARPAARRARPPTATWTRSSRCSTRPRASSTGCPVPGPQVFVDHLLAQQIPGDTLSRPEAPTADAVPILTAHASKGLEWDLVCVAGVQEGSWPDLRRRGSLLGAEQLVDLAAGRSSRGQRPRSRRSWPRSGGCSTSRSPGPGACSWSPR